MGPHRHGQARRRACDLFYYRDDRPLYLLLAYAKAQASDLSPEEKKAVAALAATLRDKQDKVIEP